MSAEVIKLTDGVVITPEARRQIDNARKHIDGLIHSYLDRHDGKTAKLLEEENLSTVIVYDPPGSVAQKEIRIYYREEWGFSDVVFKATPEGCRVWLKAGSELEEQVIP